MRWPSTPSTRHMPNGSCSRAVPTRPPSHRHEPRSECMSILSQADAEPASAERANASMEERLAFKSRFVLVFGEIDDKLALATCRRLLALSEDSDAPITMLISSPGGHVESGDAIHDMIRFVRAPVTTVGTGWVASAGAHIFLAPPRERRLCLPNTRFMSHQPAGGGCCQATNIC